MTSGRPLAFLVMMVLLQSATSIAWGQSADYEFFKTRVEPIFLKARPNHGRCVTCHGNGNGGAFVLQPLAPGTPAWTEEQSKRNYAAASRLVSPGNPTSSHLLMHPLAPEAGSLRRPPLRIPGRPGLAGVCQHGYAKSPPRNTQT
jgi:hypothetical protein